MYSHVDKYLGILAIIFLILYISLISSDRYINKNSPEWKSASLDDQKYVGYTNMVGNFLMILICGFDSVLFMNSKKVYTSRYVGKLIILMIFIGLAYDVVPNNTEYGKFNASLQPLVGYLQVLSIGTIVQIITKLDIKLHSGKRSIFSQGSEGSEGSDGSDGSEDDGSESPHSLGLLVEKRRGRSRSDSF